MSITGTKYFTPKEAQKTLPLVQQIVDDILVCGEKMRDLILDLGDFTEDDSRIRELTEKINKYIAELEEIGCFYRDWNFSMGLVDFPSVIDGEEVMLCWRSDEPNVLFYHGVDEGYKGRKRIPDIFLI